MSDTRRGFTLVELIVSLLVLLLLSSLALPAVQNLRQAAYHQQTINNLKQLNQGMINCADTNRGLLPPACDKYPTAQVEPATTVHVHLLPYVEQPEIYKRYMKAGGKGDVALVAIDVFIAGEDNSNAANKVKGVQNFAANLRLFCNKGRKAKYDQDIPQLGPVEGGLARFPASIMDGTSNTISFGTKHASCGDGGSRYVAEPDHKFAAFFGQNAAKKPADSSDAGATYQLQPSAKECRSTPLTAQSFAKSLLVGLCDGSVRELAPTLSAETWNRALCTRDGLRLGPDW